MARFVPDRLRCFVAGLPASTSLQVAFSGGLDSTVLLHALYRLRDRLDVPIGAVHVDHGLHPASRAWSEHCAAFCSARDIPFVCLRVACDAPGGEGMEAVARRVRYAALGDWLPDRACLLTAHNQDDQAETLLLQLLRGAGPAGLAAMARLKPFGRGWHGRPLLDVGRAGLRAWAEAEGLAWIEDPSNADVALDRNFLRHRVLPVLRERWPQAARTIGRSAAHQQAVLSLLDELAAEDLAQCRGSRAETLSVAALQALSAARRRNLVRHWLARQGLRMPSRAVLEQILRQMPTSRPDATPRVAWSEGEVRRYRDDLYATTSLPEPPRGLRLTWDVREALAIPQAGGVLRAVRVEGAGVACRCLAGEAVSVRFRRGGERLRPAGAAHHRTLKHLFQEAGIPPWERDLVPLIHIGGRLMAVAGLWVAEEAAAPHDETGVQFIWSRFGERCQAIASPTPLR